MRVLFVALCCLMVGVVVGLTVPRASSEGICVMVNGMPGPMAVETARACVDRGFTVLPVGFTGGSGRVTEIDVQGVSKSVKVGLVKGPSFGPDAVQALRALKAQHPRLVVIDYTHPSATLSNLQTYVDWWVLFLSSRASLYRISLFIHNASSPKSLPLTT